MHEGAPDASPSVPPAMSGAPMAANDTAAGAMMMGGSEMGMLDCWGDPIPERQGNWQGHVFPGTIFIVWAIHWFVSASWRHIVATRAGRPYRAHSTEGLLPMISKLDGFNRFPVESILKAVGGILLFVLQVTYGRYKNLVCYDGPRTGRFATQHLNSWAHASMNLGFSLSGFVELVGLRSRLPEGTNLSILSGAFLIEALLFSMHEKNGHLDQTLHWLLAQCCWAGAAFTALEAAFPSAFILTAGRVAATILQGTWFWESAIVLFAGSLHWNDLYKGVEDEAPAMFLPMVFTYHMLVVAALLVAVYSGLEALYRRRYPEEAGPDGLGGGAHVELVGSYENTRLLPARDLDGMAADGGMKSVPLSTLRPDGIWRG